MGATALMIAVSNSRVDLVIIFIDRGARINMQDNVCQS